MSHNFLLDATLNPVLGQLDTAPVTAQVAGTTAPPPAAPQQEEGGFSIWWMYGIWIVVIVGFYFLTIRPQRKKEKEVREMQQTIKVGDNIITNSGMYGRVAEVGDDCFVIEFGINRGVRIPVSKTSVQGIREPNLTAPIANTETE